MWLWSCEQIKHMYKHHPNKSCLYACVTVCIVERNGMCIGAYWHSVYIHVICVLTCIDIHAQNITPFTTLEGTGTCLPQLWHMFTVVLTLPMIKSHRFILSCANHWVSTPISVHIFYKDISGSLHCFLPVLVCTFAYLVLKIATLAPKIDCHVMGHNLLAMRLIRTDFTLPHYYVCVQPSKYTGNLSHKKEW